MMDPDDAQLDAVMTEVTKAMVDFLKVQRHPEMPVSDIMQVFRREKCGLAVAQSLVEHNIPWEPAASLAEVLALPLEVGSRGGMNHCAGGFMAFIPGGGCVYAALANLIADVMNRYTAVFLATPGMIQLEVNVLRWLTRLFDLPTDTGFGTFTSGASTSNMYALIAARRTHFGDSDDFRRGVIFTSNQAHYCIRKSAVLSGFHPRQIVEVPVDADFRIIPKELESAIAAARADGQVPLMVIGSAGTTNTGAVDDFAALHRIAQENQMWFHIDAAYGGFFYMTDRGRRALAGMGNADSIALDFHKSFFLPHGTGALLVRDRTKLKSAMDVSTGEYMPQVASDEGDFVNFFEYGHELTRPPMGFRVWLPVKVLGMGAFRAMLNEKLDLTTSMEAQVAKIPGVSLVVQSQLTTFAFVAEVPTGVRASVDALAVDSPDQIKMANSFNRLFVERINERKAIFLAGTLLHGKFVVRVTVLHMRSTSEIADRGIAAIAAAAAELRAKFATLDLDVVGTAP
eukprot:Hpha_TRINITY_DN497_c0_g1::TRINITY_DN497_c0_g1_i1::g.27549::m.27549